MKLTFFMEPQSVILIFSEKSSPHLPPPPKKKKKKKFTGSLGIKRTKSFCLTAKSSSLKLLKAIFFTCC